MKQLDNEIKKTEEMVKSLNEKKDTTQAEASAIFEVTIDEINNSLLGIDSSDDSSAKKVSRLKKTTKKTLSQLADEVVTKYLNDRSDKNWKDLYEFFWYGIMQFSYNYVKDWDAAADMAIETFANAYEKIDSYDYEKARFSTWLWTICRNICIRYLKQKARIPLVNTDISKIYEADIPNAAYTPNTEEGIKLNIKPAKDADNLEPEDVVKELYNVSIAEIERMKDVGAEILKMKIVQGMKIREIAKQLGMNESTVKNHLYRSKENLARILKINHKDLYDLYIEASADNQESFF